MNKTSSKECWDILEKVMYVGDNNYTNKIKKHKFSLSNKIKNTG